MIKALKVLLGFKCRIVQTFEPLCTYKNLVYLRRSVPVRYRLRVAYRVLKHVTTANDLCDFYTMQVLTSEAERRAMRKGLMG